MRVIIKPIILLTFMILASCSVFRIFSPTYWEFKEEIDFVQLMLDNPDSTKQIIESSKFYDSVSFDKDYTLIIGFIKNKNLCINKFRWEDVKLYDPEPFSSSKTWSNIPKVKGKLISINSDNGDQILVFEFIQKEGSYKLVRVGIVLIRW